MFLNKLNKNEKELFLSLAIYAAEANGVVEEQEKAMIKAYSKEMDLVSFDMNSVRPFDEITSVFRDSLSENKKIVVLEIIGLMNADGSYDESEKNFVCKLASSIGVSVDSVNKLSALTDRYRELVEEIAVEICAQE